MTNTFVNSELKKLKKFLNDSLSVRFIQKLSNDQKQDIYKDILVRLFNVPTLNTVFDDSISNVDKLFHFDLMKSTLIKIGKLTSEKFKQIDNLNNDKEEIKLIEVLSDTIDRPVTLPYLIPNLCDCTIASIELLFKHLNNNQKSIEVKIDEKFDKKLNDKISKTIDEKLNASAQKANDSKKIYKVYSNKTSEYYEAKRTTTRKLETTAEDVKLKDEKKFLEQKVNEIALESNKLHQLNQQYRRNKEELQDELLVLKEKYHRLSQELDEKNSIIEEKQNHFEDLEIELNTIKVQLESIYKQNELLDTDKLTLSSSASSLQKRIQELERQNDSSKEEFFKLKKLLNKREEQIEYLELNFSEKKSILEQNRMQLKKLIDDEQNHKRQLEQMEIQEKEIKFKYEKIIKELELKQQNLTENSMSLKEQIENLKIKLDDKVQENFKLNLELKECDSKVNNLKQDKEEDEKLLKQYREDKSLLLKKLEQSNQELNRLKKLNLELNKLMEIKSSENEQYQSDLNCTRNENIELTNRLTSIKNENLKQQELNKKSHSNELKQKLKVVEELTQSLEDLKIKLDNLNEEKKLFLKLFTYIENISDSNQQLPVSLNQENFGQTDELKIKRQQINLQFDHYLDLIKELKNEFKCKQLELNRSKESNRLIENEYEEQKNFLQSIQQKLNSNSSQLKIKDCELIHLRDELAEFKVKRNEDELTKINLMKENDNLKDEKSSLELLNLELKQKITNNQLRNVDLENQLQINLNKIIELEKFINEFNEKHQQLNDELRSVNELLVESANAKDQLDRELKKLHKQIKETEQLYQNETEVNSNLTEINRQLLNDKNKLEKDLNQMKVDNEQLEYDLDKIEKEFKDYENRYKKLIDDRTLLIDLINKYNIILKSHLNPELQFNCVEFIHNRTCLKLIKPECLMQSLLKVQNDQSKLKRQIESLKLNSNEQKIKLEEESNLNLEYKALIEFNENNLMSKRINCEKLFSEQKDFKIQLDQTLKENEKLKIEKDYLTQKVLSLDKILESTNEFMQQKFEETRSNHKLIEHHLNSLNKFDIRIDNQNLNLEDMEMRLIYMYESLTEFMNILMKKIDDYKAKVSELNEINTALNDRLNEMNHLLDKCADKENNLRTENENLKKELIASNLNSKEVDNKVKQLTNQINDLQNECLTLQNSLESNRLTMNDLIETNNRLKIRIKQLEATINLCEIKMKESEQNLSKKSNQVIGRDSEIIHLKSNQNQMQNELKKLQLQNKIMNNELNQTLIKSHVKLDKNLMEENLNKFINFNPDRTISKNAFRQEKKFKQEIVKKINIK